MKYRVYPLLLSGPSQASIEGTYILSGSYPFKYPETPLEEILVLYYSEGMSISKNKDFYVMYKDADLNNKLIYIVLPRNILKYHIKKIVSCHGSYKTFFNIEIEFSTKSSKRLKQKYIEELRFTFHKKKFESCLKVLMKKINYKEIHLAFRCLPGVGVLFLKGKEDFDTLKTIFHFENIL